MSNEAKYALHGWMVIIGVLLIIVGLLWIDLRLGLVIAGVVLVGAGMRWEWRHQNKR